jgi:nicotinamidase-related amidase
MKLDLRVTALAFTDLHNDFLAPQGKAYGLIKDSLARNNTAENIELLLRAAGSVGMKVFVSPHYYYPYDHRWVAPVTPLEDLAHKVGLVDRKHPLSLEGFEGSGADAISSSRGSKLPWSGTQRPGPLTRKAMATRRRWSIGDSLHTRCGLRQRRFD